VEGFTIVSTVGTTTLRPSSPAFVQQVKQVNGAMPITPTTSSNTRLHMSIPTPIDTLTSGLASIVRFPHGVTVDTRLKKTTSSSSSAADDNNNNSIRIAKLYDIENNADCRQVREKITELDLVVETVIPATPNSRAMTSEDVLPPSKVPRMVVVEAASGAELVLDGALEIVEYLEDTFLDNSTALAGNLVEEEQEGPMAVLSSIQIPYEVTGLLAGLLRLGRGSRVVTAALSPSSPRRPKKKLILYNYEGNQFCRLVREVLTELDLEYEMRPTGELLSTSL
jgi:hypothetical protein